MNKVASWWANMFDWFEFNPDWTKKSEIEKVVGIDEKDFLYSFFWSFFEDFFIESRAGLFASRLTLTQD